MYLYFNKNGTLTTQINHGEVPRQGANLDVHALVDLDFFEEQGDYHLDDWTALLKVVDTLGNTALSGATMDGPKLITFVKANNAEATFNLVNGQNYYAFDFLINSSIYSDVTALSGNIKIGVSFINTDSSLNVVGGECTLYIEPVLKDSYIKNNINPSQYRQLMSKIEQAEFYVTNNIYNNYSVSYNLVVNRNGYQVPNVKFETISIEQYSGYTVKQLRDNTTNTKIEDISKIKEYLTAITGNGRIPKYNESKPSDQFIICAVDNSMWKMQYDETNGLLAFKVENVPLLDTKQDTLTYTSIIDVSDVCLYEKDEDPTSDGTDGRLENISGGLYFNGNPVFMLGNAISVNNTEDNIQAIIASNTSSVIKGNLSSIISSDNCSIGDTNTDKNGRQVVISSKSSITNGNDTAIVAARQSEIISDENSHSTESAIIGGYSNTINKTQRAVIIGGSENTINAVSGSDALYGFIGGGQNNEVKHRNSATIGGQHLITSGPEQSIVGRYNDNTLSSVLFAVGNGSSVSSRSNALTVYNDGTVDVKKISINSPLRIFGGDSATDAKIILDQSASGQITDSGTKTIFGFTSNGSSDLKVGSSSYSLSLRGSGTRPTYNGNDVALTSDLSNYVTTNTTQTGLTGDKTFVDSSIKVQHSLYPSNCTLITRSGIDIQYNNGSYSNKSVLGALELDIISGSDATIYRVGQISNKISSENFAVLTLPTTTGELALKDDIPSTYIKSASVSGNTLTLTKQDNTTVKFTPSGGGEGGGLTLLYNGNCDDISGSTATQIGNSELYAISGYIDTENLETLIGAAYLSDKLFIEVIGGGDSHSSSNIFPLTEDYGYYRFYGIWDDTIDGAIMGAHDEINIYKLG